MTRSIKILAILALIGAAGVAGQAVFANCVNEGPYEVRQCSKGAWFEAPGAGAGPVTAVWWGIGFGNNNIVSATAETIGNGFLNTPLPGVFIGVDNGSLTATGLDLVDASTAGIGAPPNTLCFSAGANWGSPGLDSCIDINRTSGAPDPNSTANVSDNIVNKYWDSALGTYCPYPGPYDYVYYNHQLDPPMGVLLTEGSGQYFAAAFFASIPKTPPVQCNPDPGQYSLGAVHGDTGPFGDNLVPWQPIPLGNVSAVITSPADPNSTRNIFFNWAVDPNAPVPVSSVRFIYDGSHRPCWSDSPSNTTPCASVLGVVGVLDQGPLIHFEVESTGMDAAGNCLTTWATVPGTRVDDPAFQTVANGIPANSCVRLKTTFGRTPAATLGTTATAAQRNLNRAAVQGGKIGDIGYTVASAAVKVGGSLVSQRASLKAVSREKNSVRVVFDTDTEVSINSFDVIGIDNRGGRKVIGTVACTQCTTGLGASYNTLIPDVKLQGAKTLQIVIQPSGVQSNTLNLK